MKDRRRAFPFFLLSLVGMVLFAGIAFTPAQASGSAGQAAPAANQSSPPATGTDSKTLVAAGSAVFQKNCSFCHGRDAEGGETGPDLTRSKYVAGDVGGDRISVVVREGRPAKGMPAFSLSASDMAAVVAFIHAQMAGAENGGRRGVDVSDLQTGNADAGKEYFNGAGTCSKCHSPTGDLAGIASRYQGLDLERRFLYPENVRPKATVTLRSGQQISGTLDYLDEFTIGLYDASGTYHSWPVSAVKYHVDPGLDAHFELLGKYSDDDVHNLMAYLQTLR